MPSYTDVVNGHVQSQFGGTHSLIAGKVGNAAQESGQCLIYNTTPRIVLTDPNVAGWTVAGWVNPVSSVGTHTALVELFNFSFVQAMIQFNFQAGTAVFTHMGSGQTRTINALGPVTGSGWNFFCMKYEGGLFQGQINDSLQVVSQTGTVGAWPVGADWVLELDNLLTGARVIAFDEVSVWDQGLTGPQVAALYNNGNGVTWPVTL